MELIQSKEAEMIIPKLNVYPWEIYPWLSAHWTLKVHWRFPSMALPEPCKTELAETMPTMKGTRFNQYFCTHYTQHVIRQSRGLSPLYARDVPGVLS
jgi:hypothetical protein